MSCDLFYWNGGLVWLTSAFNADPGAAKTHGFHIIVFFCISSWKIEKHDLGSEISL